MIATRSRRAPGSRRRDAPAERRVPRPRQTHAPRFACQLASSRVERERVGAIRTAQRTAVRMPLRPRLLASQAGDDASTKETASSLALISQSAIVLYVPTTQMFSYWQAAACPRVARKSATYRSPRCRILAALVPSVGTIASNKEFGSRAGAHERPGIRASRTDPCVSSQGKEIRAPQ